MISFMSRLILCTRAMCTCIVNELALVYNLHIIKIIYIKSLQNEQYLLAIKYGELGQY